MTTTNYPQDVIDAEEYGDEPRGIRQIVAHAISTVYSSHPGKYSSYVEHLDEAVAAITAVRACDAQHPTHTPDVSDEARELVVKAIRDELPASLGPATSGDWTYDDMARDAADAVLAALASSGSAAVGVPSWVDRIEISHEDDGNWFSSLREWRKEPRAYGDGGNPVASIAAAIADAAIGEDE